MIKQIATFAAVAAIAMTTTALAQDEKEKKPRGDRAAGHFDKIDADGDGKITLEEMQAGAVKRAAKAFERMDKDGDKAVTKEEFQPPHRPGARDPRKGRKGGGDAGDAAEE